MGIHRDTGTAGSEGVEVYQVGGPGSGKPIVEFGGGGHQ